MKKEYLESFEKKEVNDSVRAVVRLVETMFTSYRFLHISFPLPYVQGEEHEIFEMWSTEKRLPAKFKAENEFIDRLRPYLKAAGVKSATNGIMLSQRDGENLVTLIAEDRTEKINKLISLLKSCEFVSVEEEKPKLMNSSEHADLRGLRRNDTIFNPYMYG